MDKVYVERKHGRLKVEYKDPVLEPILEDTYGVILYQEQVMQIASTMGAFTMGQADTLRKAMGKKKMEMMADMKVQFLAGAEELGFARRVAVENATREEVQLTGLRLWVPGAGMGASAGCTFDAPANMVRPRVPLPLAASQSLQGEPGLDFAPGARGRMGYAMEDAPDVSPGLMVVHNPALRLSLLAWYFLSLIHI